MRGAVITVLLVAAAAYVSADQSKDADDRAKFFFGTYRTTTYTVVSASTSTVFATCLSGSDTTLCAGRSARRAKRKLEKSLDEVTNVGDLSGSLLDTKSVAETLEGVEEKDKLAFTVWTTSRTTTSVTVFFTNTSTTVRVSFYCVAGGLSVPNGCAGTG
ncbi:uncharacterized protein LOC122253914 [Penaeus japonicus]|uniref:uncharacterized protein LOC122253914 n=1 Tax=Penaeus japonicus TaxID=27405 RepID=UPI001C70FD33|nr:uncharacterized protein LOC122253914 [Penaeus japonicus]